MRVDIIGSGSNGNCTLFRSDAHEEWVMFDCGIPNVKRKIKEYNKNTNVLFIILKSLACLFIITSATIFLPL